MAAILYGQFVTNPTGSRPSQRLRLMAFIVCVMGFAMAANLYTASERTYRNASENLTESAKLTSRLLADALSGLVYNYQLDEINKLIKDFTDHNQFVSAEIRDTRGRVLATYARTAAHDQFVVRQTLKGSDQEELGLLDVAVSRDGILAATRSAFFYDSLVGSIQVIAILLVVYVGTSRMVGALAKAKDQMQEQALRDPLTGLLNRRGVEAGIEERHRRARDCKLALIHIDLDRFKAINDRLGHAAGDRVLGQVAQRMRRHCRDTDLLARIGGDEFLIAIVLGPRQDFDLGRYGDRLITALNVPMPKDVTTVNCGASVGMTLCQLSSAEDFATAMVHADLALYEAKRSGRARACIYKENMGHEFSRVETLIDELMRGLDQDEFEPWFQPQVNCRTGEIEAIEALVRWVSPKRGTLAPASFLDVASAAGLLERIDRRVFTKATDALVGLRAAGLETLTLSVNLEGPRLKDPTLCASLAEELAGKGLSPRDISLEIVESALLDTQNEQIKATVHALSDAGFVIELDDFGTGYASIASLVNFPVSRVKIDRQFVSGVDDDDKKLKVLQALVHFGRELDVDVIAEGVETEGEWRAVREMNCDAVQGYFLARPMAAEDILVWKVDQDVNALIEIASSARRPRAARPDQTSDLRAS